MGCDIHVCVETRQTVNGKKRWVNIDDYEVNQYYGEKGEPMFNRLDAYKGRDYALFTMLAGIRGYAGNETISAPKGFPSNADKHTKKGYKRWEGDAHSASYFTLAELKAWMETHKTVKHSGYVSVRQAKDLDEKGILPLCWCQWTSDTSALYREWEERNNSLKGFIKSIEDLYKRKNYWNPKINKEKSEEIRVVFWFDN